MSVGHIVLRGFGPRYDLPIATALSNLATLRTQERRFDEAAALYAELLPTAERVYGPDHPETLISQTNYSQMLFDQKRYAESLAVLQRLDTEAAIPTSELVDAARSNVRRASANAYAVASASSGSAAPASSAAAAVESPVSPAAESSRPRATACSIVPAM